jgi:hypothetical protein
MILVTTGGGGASSNLIFPLWFTLLGGSFVFLDVGSFHFVPFIPPFFWVLWFIYDWQGFINQLPSSH